MLKKILLLLLALFIMNVQIYGYDIHQGQKYSIQYFAPWDLSYDMYSVSIKAKNPKILIDEIMKSKGENSYVIEVDGITCPINKDSVKLDDDDTSQVSFEVEANYPLPAGEKVIIKLLHVSGEDIHELASTDRFKVPDRMATADKQPLINSLTPEAGKRGDTIKIMGHNFGNDIDDIQIMFYPSEKAAEGTRLKEVFPRRKPFYISTPAADSLQELRFNIPISRDLLQSNFYKKTLLVRVVVAGRPSNYIKFVVLTDKWKIWIASLSLFVLLILYLMLAYVMKRLNFLDSLLIDKDTNTYSLSKFQAIVWTVILLGSYFYIAISNGLLLGNGTIPDFNPSLIGLLSISYGGMIGATGLGSKKPKNEVVRNPPHLSNLFSSGGSIDIPRLQLFGFTIVGAIIYVYNLINANPLDGLPEIPTTFLGLMGVSQSGYLGGKVIGDKASINIVKPYYVPSNFEEGHKIHILGAGFEKNTKVLLDELSEPLETEFLSGSALGVVIPKLSTAGPKKITLLPPGKPPISSEECFETILFDQYKFPANLPFSFKMYSHTIKEGLSINAIGEMEDFYEGIMNFTGSDFEITFPRMLPGYKRITIFSADRKIEINLDRAILIEPPMTFTDDDNDTSEEEVAEDDGGNDNTNEETESSGPVSFDTGSSGMPPKSFFLDESNDKSNSRVSVIEFIINP
jgi:hypothetical protein